MVDARFSGFQKRDATGPLIGQVWQSATPAHAIVMASGVMQFSENITSLTIRKAVDAVRASALRHGLAKEDGVNSVLFRVAPGAAPTAASPENVGTTFMNMMGDQIVQSLSITGDAVRFESRIYTRWIAFRALLLEFLNAILPVTSQSSIVTSVGLEYRDLFIAVNEGTADASMIIDRKSDLIAKKAFARNEPFHSHAGWFEDMTPDSRRLINMDIDVTDSHGPPGIRRTISIRTHEAFHVLNPESDMANKLADAENVVSLLDALHANSKKQFGAVLTHDARMLISLGS